MKASDVRSKTADELKDQLVDLKKEQFNLRFQRATQQLEKPTEVKQVRRDIARIKTILGRKERSEVRSRDHAKARFAGDCSLRRQ